MLAEGMRRLVAAIERRAGRMHPPHFRSFLAFMEPGGLPTWLLARGTNVLAERRYVLGNLALVAVANTP